MALETPTKGRTATLTGGGGGSTVVVMSPARPHAKGFAQTVSKQEYDRLSDTEKQYQEVVFELIDTERQYVADLKQMVNLFMQPCLKWGILEKEDAGRLFLNVETLYDLNCKFLAALESLQARSVVVTDPVGPIVLAHTDMFKLYAVYCAHQKPATFDELKASNSKFAGFVDDCSKRDDWRGVPLSAYLHKPIARICKYPLLLTQLLKCTPKESPDYAAVSDALEKLKAVVDRINERTRQVEMMNRLDEIEKSLGESGKDLGLALHSRKLVREGLLLEGGKNEEIQVYLFNDMLLLARPRKSKPGKFELKRHAMLLQVSATEYGDIQLELSWTSQDARDSLRFNSREERDSWKVEILSLIRAAHGAQDRLQKGPVGSAKNLQLQQRPSSPMLGRGEKRLLLVHWPQEITGLNDYSKVLAPELSDTVQQVIQKMLASPVARESLVPLKIEEWGLYCERLGCWLDDSRTLGSYNLQDKELVYFRRHPRTNGDAAAQAQPQLARGSSQGSLSTSQGSPQPAIPSSGSGLKLPLSGSQVIRGASESAGSSRGDKRSPSPLPVPATDKLAELAVATKDLQAQAQVMKAMDKEMAELKARLAQTEAERDELRAKVQALTAEVPPVPPPRESKPTTNNTHAATASTLPPPPSQAQVQSTAQLFALASATAPPSRGSPLKLAAAQLQPEVRVARAESGRGPALPRPLGLTTASRPAEASPVPRMPPPSAAPPPLAAAPPVHPALAASLDVVLFGAAGEIAASRGVAQNTIDVNAWKTSLGRLVRSAEALARLVASPGWSEIKIEDGEKTVIKRRVEEFTRAAAAAAALQADKPQ